MIELSEVSKHYGSIAALSHVSFHIESGVVGLLGPNGAGKSTVLRLVTGFIGPDQGTVRVMGANPLEHTTRRQIGYLPEGAPLPADSTVLEILDFTARCRGIARGQRPQVLRQVTERLNLDPYLSRISDSLSKGQRRRVALACALIDRPPILVLDEPTDGLDPNQRAAVHGLIRDLSASCLILISTHILEEVEQLCERALILAGGRLLIDGTPQQISRMSRHHNAVHLDLSPEADLDVIRTTLLTLPSVCAVEVERLGRRLTALAHPDQHPFHAVTTLVTQLDWQIEGLHVEHGRLHEVFRAATAGQAAE
jgi:ABC-2 type transport system ATP-binding protein